MKAIHSSRRSFAIPLFPMLCFHAAVLATGGFAQTVLVVDGAANQVKSFTPASSGSWSFNGIVISGTHGGAALSSLWGMAAHGNRLFVAEGKAGGRVLEFTTAGAFVKTVYTFPTSTSPRMLTFGPDGYLYMSDAFGTSGDCIWRIDVNLNTASVFITQAAGAFAQPHGMAFASDGHLYIADRDTAGAGASNGRVKRFSSGGALLNGNVATLPQPMGLAWDEVGTRLLVGCGFGGVVRSVTLGGTSSQLIDDSANFAYLDFAVIDGQVYGTRNGNSTTTAGVCRVNGTLPAPLVTGTNFAGTTAQMVVLPPDTDTDGLPDPWELKYFIQVGENPVADAATILARQTGATDPDGDGLDNSGEFAALTNPTVADTDSDGLTDGAETGSGVWVSAVNTGTKPLLPDSDGDGLLDGQENNSGTYVGAADPGTNPNLADTDGDTFKDYLEIARGADPLASASTPGSSSATPVVDLNAAGLSAGALTAWANTGTIGKSFVADTEPVVEMVGGVKGVTFTGTEVLTGPAAPSSLTGSSPRTIEAWIFNPTSSSEETIVGWGRRDGPNGTACAFFHGTNPNFGAVGNWGTQDMAWGPDAAAIANHVKLGSWTYVVYTYDGGSSNVGTVYANGNLANTEALGALNTFATDNTAAARPLPIRVAGQNAANGTLATTGEKGTLTLARLRIHDRVLSAADLGFNDADGDGMKDWYEEFYGLNKAVNDADGDPDADGLSNLQEQTAGTHPNLADTDADGMSDGWEFSNFGNQATSPDADADLDGATNLEEFKTLTTLLIARDGEGAITGTTTTAGSSNPNDRNSQPDSDTDGLPDGWEALYLGGIAATPAADADGDTFSNLAEFTAGSRPDDIMSTPIDTDADGLADAWEKLHFGGIAGQNGSGDPDDDGATNEAEETGGSLPNSATSQPDNDHDGLPDGSEMIYFGNLDQNDTTDFDGDTFSDLAEFTAGSNPIRSGNTPVNIHDTVRVAVATGTALDEWSVTDNVWSKTRTISAGLVDTLVFHQGAFFAVAGTQVVRIDPVTGERTILASAPLAGWTDAAGRDLEVGPDGKLYFATAFGTSAGQGVFRLNPDGSGFEQFIARTGGTAPDNWELNNAIGLVWHGNDLYVSSRAGFGATNRPIYKFDATGAYLGKFATGLTGPMGLCLDGENLVYGGSNNPSALVSLSLADAAVQFTKSGYFSVDAINILGELHTITFSSGEGGMGNILKAGPRAAMTIVNNNLGAVGSDMVVFTQSNPDSDADGLPDAWETTHFGNLDQTASGDPDGDGSANWAEYRIGLDPKNGTERFASVVAGTPSTGVTLTWPSQPGLTFTIRSSTDLTDWTTVEATVPAAASPAASTSWTSPAIAGAQRFFRVEIAQ